MCLSVHPVCISNKNKVCHVSLFKTPKSNLFEWKHERTPKKIDIRTFTYDFLSVVNQQIDYKITFFRLSRPISAQQPLFSHFKWRVRVRTIKSLVCAHMKLNLHQNCFLFIVNCCVSLLSFDVLLACVLFDKVWKGKQWTKESESEKATDYFVYVFNHSLN